MVALVRALVTPLVKSLVVNGGVPPIVVPTPVHNADYNNVADAVGVVMTGPVANIGSAGGNFTFPVGREFTVGQRYGKKTANSINNQKCIIPPAIIPQAGSYSFLIASQITSFASSMWYTQYRTGNIDIMLQHNFAGHNGTTVPTNGFALTTPILLGFDVRVVSYNSVTGIMSVYENENLLASGAVPARLGSITAAIFNNNANVPGTSGLTAEFMADKVWNVALSAAEAAQACREVRDLYNATYNRFTPPNAQKSYAMWGDSMYNTPDAANKLPTLFQALYTPNAYVYPGGVNGETSTQVKTRFDARVVDRHVPNFFACMRNDNAAAITAATGVTNLQGMVAQLDDTSKYLIQLPHFNNTELAAGPGNAAYDAIDVRRNAVIAAFPANRLYEVGDIYRANTSDIGTHPNAAGSALAVTRIKGITDGFGW